MIDNLKDIAVSLDELLSKSDISSITSESSQGYDLPDGYYLCEVEKADLKLSSNGNPMVSIQYKVVENGLKSDVDKDGNDTLIEARGTANRKIFMNYVLSTEQQVNFFVSDMLKFEEADKEGVPMFEKDYFKNTELLMTVLDILSNGLRIYIMVQSKESKKEPGKIEKRYNPITWKRAKLLELPM